MTSDSRPPREWLLPLNTLIINSSFTRGGDEVHVIEKSAYDLLAKELADVVSELGEQGPFTEGLVQELAESRKNHGIDTECNLLLTADLAEARAEIERLRPRLHWTERDWRSDCEIAEEQLQSQAALIDSCEEAMEGVECILIGAHLAKHIHLECSQAIQTRLSEVLAEIAKFKECGE